MAVGLDLKPLSEETITEMGYNSHDLWLVKIGVETFGPYETESLKHYVAENEHLFEEAHASRMDQVQWHPFWEHTVFQRRKPQSLGEAHEGPFWLMLNGLKVGPLSFQDIDKKIEMGILVMTDHISVDDGHSWTKIFHIAGFDRRTYSPDELPIAPMESSFQKAKLAVVEKMDQPHVHLSEELAEMAWSGQQQAKVIQFKIDEMTLQAPRTTEVSDSVKWAVPAAAAVVMAIMTTGYFMFSTDSDDIVAENGNEKQFYQPGAETKKTPRGAIPNSGARFPASTGYGSAPTYNYNNGSSASYPTHMDVHENYDEPIQERDPLDGPVTDAEPAIEHSLVGNENNGAGESLDAAMNGISQPAEQPIVDEASDF
jgi:hypothetical protein